MNEGGEKEKPNPIKVLAEEKGITLDTNGDELRVPVPTTEEGLKTLISKLQVLSHLKSTHDPDSEQKKIMAQLITMIIQSLNDLPCVFVKYHDLEQGDGEIGKFFGKVVFRQFFPLQNIFLGTLEIVSGPEATSHHQLNAKIMANSLLLDMPTQSSPTWEDD